MLKRLATIGKWVAGVFLVAGAIVVMTRKEEQTRIKYQRQCQEHVAAVPVAPGHEENGTRQCEDTKDYMPWWYVLTAWPEGIGVWAVLATGFLIGWQSYETRRAADAAVLQIEMTRNRERARLTISLQPLTEIDSDYFLSEDVRATIRNIGYSHAFNVRFEYRCEITASETEPTITARNSGRLEIVRAAGETESVPFSFAVTAEDQMWDHTIVPGAGNLFVHLWGTARFENGFGNHGSLQFHHIFTIDKLCEVPGSTALAISGLSKLRGWRQCQRPECNRET